MLGPFKYQDDQWHWPRVHVDSEMKEKQIKIFILEYVKLAVEKWLVKSFWHTDGTNIITLSTGGQQKKRKKIKLTKIF
jgi:hypothetical protein